MFAYRAHVVPCIPVIFEKLPQRTIGETTVIQIGDGEQLPPGLSALKWLPAIRHLIAQFAKRESSALVDGPHEKADADAKERPSG